MARGRVTLLSHLLASTTLALLSLTPSADAQVQSDPTGFHLGARLNGAAITTTDGSGDESGSGVGLSVGWGFNHRITLYAEGAVASMEKGDYTLMHSDLGVRMNLGGEASRTLGFLTLATGTREGEFTDSGFTFAVSGSTLTFGGGGAYFFNPSLSIDVGLKWTVGTFDTFKAFGVSVTTQSDYAATSTRFDIGISKYFQW